MEIIFGIPAVIFIIFIFFYAFNYEKFQDNYKDPKENNSGYSFKAVKKYEYKTFHNVVLSPSGKSEYQSSNYFNGGYNVYLQSDEWNTKRYIVLSRDHFKCVKCPSTINLNVHHKTYQNVYFEEDNHFEDLETLCKICHSEVDHAPIMKTWPGKE